MKSPKRIENNQKTNVLIGILTLCISILGYILYLFTLSLISSDKNYDSLIFLFSWLGILLAIYIVFTWRRVTGYIFSPYTIFMLFFLLFNYGQSLMWAFGIHKSMEIGQATLYSGFGVANDSDIIKAQALTLISILMFHFGAILSSRKIKIVAQKRKQVLCYQDTSKILKAIYYSSLLLGLLIIPNTLLHAYSDLQTSLVYGYKSLYYSEFANNDATVFALLRRMFFPCLIGLLIGSRYNKKVRISVYIIFSIYLMLNLLAGDRGSWLYKVFTLVWLSHVFYKPINFKKGFKYVLFSIFVIYVTDVIVSFRNTGLSNISISDLRESLSFQNSIFIEPFFEMGGSMNPTIILQKYGWDVWPYANTYLLAMLGMVTNKIIYILDIPFSTISSWFSQEYLGISYGAGFSIIAEALLNFGPLIAPLIMILLGYLISSLIFVNKNSNYKQRPLRLLFVVVTLDVITPVTRNYFHLLLKDWFYGVVVFLIFILLFKTFILKRKIYL